MATSFCFLLVKIRHIQAISGFCTQDNTFGVILKQQNLPEHNQLQWSIYWAAKVRESPRHRRGLKWEKCSGCFPEQPHLSWCSIPEYNIHCLEATSRGLFCEVFEMDIRPGSQYLAICCCLPLVKRKHFQAKYGFCSQEKMVGVIFKQ